ncbi:MAG: hypothetical protein WAL75_07440 [Terracidiphilus sp.]
MNHDGLNYGRATNPWDTMAAPLEQWVTAVKAWTDMWSAFLPAGLLSSPQQAWNPGGVGLPGVGPASSSVAVRVSSQRPTEVVATLAPGSEYLPLVAELANLPGISISRQGTVVRVELQVAPTQAAGTYQGSITAAGREVGTISVTILEPPAAAVTGPRTRKRKSKA